MAILKNNTGVKLDTHSDVLIIDEQGIRVNEQRLFLSETDEQEGYQLFVGRNLEAVLNLELALIKEASAGHGGRVDFLGIDRGGRLFLIEVKCAYDARGKFDVIFQTLKYYNDPRSLADRLYSSNQKLREDVEKELIKRFDLRTADIDEISKRIWNNLDGNHLNMIIVTDKATPQLITTAFTILLRNTGAECRIMELAPIVVAGKQYIYSRKYFSNDDWVSVSLKDNRAPRIELSARLQSIQDEKIQERLNEIITCLEEDEKLVIDSHRKNTPYFSIKRRKGGSIGAYFYTKDEMHKAAGVHIFSGALFFESELESFEHIVFSKIARERCMLGKWNSGNKKEGNITTHYYLMLPPDYMKELSPKEILLLINEYREHCDRKLQIHTANRI